ncbi:Hypp932 [Branchiostoma lanceolatum]|uniref:Hypp932 protein n=1 Tax=Branchiostoma lanceolatum TaxID=7740 RepID=A0A8J9ZFS0_BRALA|nr:Hypp932 [Branchiostoma lanceolatum]
MSAAIPQSQLQRGDMRSLSEPASLPLVRNGHITRTEIHPVLLAVLGARLVSIRKAVTGSNFARSLMESNFRDWLPSTRGDISGRNTRNKQKLNTPLCRTNRLKNSPIPYLVTLLNK